MTKIATLGSIDPEDVGNKDLTEKPTQGTPTRASAAVTMRIAGASYTEIARTLEYSSPFYARQAVERALADSAEADTEGVGHVRNLTARRLERLLRSVMPKATNDKHPDHLLYAKTALAIIDRHAKLFGADAPQQMVVHTPATEKVQEWVDAMVKQVSPREVEAEADIFDAEIVADGEEYDKEH